MRVKCEGLMFLASGEYGGDVRRENGAAIVWADFYDVGGDGNSKSVRMTLAGDFDPAGLPAMGALVDVVANVEHRTNEKSGKGRIAWRCDSMKPAVAAGNGKAPATATANA